MPLLYTFKSQQQPFERIFPRKGALDAHASRIDRFVEQPLAPTLGGFAITRVLFDIRNHARIEDHLPITCGIKAAIEIDLGASEVQTDLFGHLLQRFQPFWKQHHIRLIHGSDW